MQISKIHEIEKKGRNIRNIISTEDGIAVTAIIKKSFLLKSLEKLKF
jgi:hypothetical protein